MTSELWPWLGTVEAELPLKSRFYQRSAWGRELASIPSCGAVAGAGAAGTRGCHTRVLGTGLLRGAGSSGLVFRMGWMPTWALCY